MDIMSYIIMLILYGGRRCRCSQQLLQARHQPRKQGGLAFEPIGQFRAGPLSNDGARNNRHNASCFGGVMLVFNYKP